MLLFHCLYLQSRPNSLINLWTNHQFLIILQAWIAFVFIFFQERKIQCKLNFLGIFRLALFDFEVKDTFTLSVPFLLQHNQIHNWMFLGNYPRSSVGLQAWIVEIFIFFQGQNFMYNQSWTKIFLEAWFGF